MLWLTFLVVPWAALIGTGFKVAELLRERELGWVWVPFMLLALASCAVSWVVGMQPELEERWNDPAFKIAQHGGTFAVKHLFAFIGGAVLGFVVAKVLGSA